MLINCIVVEECSEGILRKQCVNKLFQSGVFYEIQRKISFCKVLIIKELMSNVIEGKRQCIAVSGLAVRETSELLGITKDELQLETCSVDISDARHRGSG